MVNILTVEDNEHLLETLVEQLGLEEDLTVRGVITIEEGRQELAQLIPDILLLDVSLPDGDGRDFCRWIRAQGYSFPILMLTAQNGEMDTIDGLEAGANDYIAKPLRLRELIARIRVHLAQYQLRADARIAIGPFLFNPGNKTLSHQESGKMLNLTEKENAIIRYLASKNGKTVGKDELLKQVWGYNELITTHTLETHIYRLRQKMGYVDEKQVLVTGRNGYSIEI